MQIRVWEDFQRIDQHNASSPTRHCMPVTHLLFLRGASAGPSNCKIKAEVYYAPFVFDTLQETFRCFFPQMNVESYWDSRRKCLLLKH